MGRQVRAHMAAGHDLNYIGDTGLLSLGMGKTENPVVPPALIADIAGGAYPAVMNILLALRQRDVTGSGTHIDTAMTDNMFPFMYWALGNYHALGISPVNSGETVTGGSPRYRLYPTADGFVVAAAPLEEKFWNAFADAIGLEDEHREDDRDPQRVIARVAEIIAGRSAADWAPVFAKADCCVSIVKTLEEALRDPHFRERGLFDAVLANETGETIPALPVPVAPRISSCGGLDRVCARSWRRQRLRIGELNCHSLQRPACFRAVLISAATLGLSASSCTRT